MDDLSVVSKVDGTGNPDTLPDDGLPKTLEKDDDEVALDSDVEVPVTPDGLPIDPNAEIDATETQGTTRRFATITNLVNSVLGAGILGVSNSMKGCGYVPACLLIIAVAVLNHYGSILTIKLQFRTKAEGFDGLAKKVLGKWGSLAVSISLLIFCYSCLVAYLVIACDNIISWFDLAGVKISGKWWRALIVAINAAVISIPLTIPKSMKFLSYFAFLNLICVSLFFIVMIVKAIQIIPKNGVGPGVVAAKGGMGLFSAISVYSLAFCLPSVLLPIIKSYRPDIAKRGVVTMWAMAICVFFVLIPGLLGYLTLGDNAKSNILLSFDSGDTLVIIVRIAFYCVTSFSYPAVCKSVQSSWSEIFYGENDSNMLPPGKRAVVLALGNSIALIIAMVLPNITPALSVGGALGGALTSFFFPPLIWLILSKKPWSTPRNIGFIIYAAFGFVIVCICTYQSIIDAIDSFSGKSQ
jgi:amino acid permease